MNRKDFIQTLRKPSEKRKKQQSLKPASDLPVLPFTGGIAPYTGSWTDTEVIHLLKRCTFGAPVEEVAYFQTRGLSAAVDELLNTANTPDRIGQPMKTYSVNTTNTPADDPDWSVPLGNTWLNIPTQSGVVEANRRESVRAWWFNNIIRQPRSIEEKMILFWSTHLTVEFDTVNIGIFCHQYVQLLRTHCLGNLKDMVKAITLNPAMLVYLNGFRNTKTAPDENYARELQELFTLGKGPASQFTENDVKEAARVLTGYQINFANATSFFNPTRHDFNPKQFSSFYGNTVISRPSGQGEAELDDLLTMIFNKEEVSRYICRRLYRFFVYDDISTQTETNIIEPLAATLRSNNYNIKPVLAQLFKSQHFFDVLQYGGMIKSAVDFTAGLIRECDVRFPASSNPSLQYRHLGLLSFLFLPQMEQNLGDPPNVAGWSAYYQSPLYDRNWVTSDTFISRQNLLTLLISSGYTFGGYKLQLNCARVAARMPNPSDPNQLILDLNKYFLRRTLSQTLRDSIKVDILLSGQAQDYYWTNAWNAYVFSPEDLNAFSVVNNRLKNLMLYLLTKLEEYQLM